MSNVSSKPIKKMMPPIMASISRKSSNKVPITIFQMLLAGRRTHKNKAFFMGSRGFLWVWIMGSQNVTGLELWIMGSQNVMGMDYGKSKCYGFGLWEVKMLWVWIMGVTLLDT
jgi:hypothetical protein